MRNGHRLLGLGCVSFQGAMRSESSQPFGVGEPWMSRRILLPDFWMQFIKNKRRWTLLREPWDDFLEAESEVAAKLPEVMDYFDGTCLNAGVIVVSWLHLMSKREAGHSLLIEAIETLRWGPVTMHFFGFWALPAACGHNLTPKKCMFWKLMVAGALRQAIYQVDAHLSLWPLVLLTSKISIARNSAKWWEDLN